MAIVSTGRGATTPTRVALYERFAARPVITDWKLSYPPTGENSSFEEEVTWLSVDWRRASTFESESVRELPRREGGR